VIAEPERRLWQIGKDIRAENDLLNDLGFITNGHLLFVMGALIL